MKIKPMLFLENYLETEDVKKLLHPAELELFQKLTRTETLEDFHDIAFCLHDFDKLRQACLEYIYTVIDSHFQTEISKEIPND